MPSLWRWFPIVARSFASSSSGVNGNGCTAYDAFQRLRQCFAVDIEAAGEDESQAWAGTSAQVAKVAAESWLLEAQAEEVKGLRAEVRVGVRVWSHGLSSR